MSGEFSYIEIKNDIKNKINNNEYKVDSKIPSERELCKIYKVSRTTVRKAIEELVDENYLNKLSGKGSFVKNSKNKKTINNTKNIIFLRCLHSDKSQKNNSKISEDIFYPQVFAGIDMVADKKDYHCIFKYIYEDNLGENFLEEIIKKSDGIICGELHSQRMLNKLISTELPLVLVSPSVITDKIDIVDISNYTSAFNLTKKLIDFGHKNIAFIGGSEKSRPSIERKKGFLDLLEKNNINISNKNIISIGWRLEDGYKAAEKIISFDKLPTAIFSVSDLLAIGAINAFKDSGISVPNDISIVGFDDIDMAKQIKPSLTTMKVKKIEIGKEAANLLFQQINGERKYPIKISVPTVFKKRDSLIKINS